MYYNSLTINKVYTALVIPHLSYRSSDEEKTTSLQNHIYFIPVGGAGESLPQDSLS